MRLTVALTKCSYTCIFLWILIHGSPNRAMAFALPEVGTDLNFARVKFAFDVPTDAAFQGRVAFDDPRFLRLEAGDAGSWFIEVTFFAEDLISAIEPSFDESLTLLDRNGQPIASASDNQVTSVRFPGGAEQVGYGFFDYEFGLGDTAVHGLEWDITPTIVGTLPQTVDIGFFAAAKTGDKLGTIDVGAVPEPTSILIWCALFSACIGMRSLRRRSN